MVCVHLRLLLHDHIVLLVAVGVIVATVRIWLLRAWLQCPSLFAAIRTIISDSAAGSWPALLRISLLLERPSLVLFYRFEILGYFKLRFDVISQQGLLLQTNFQILYLGVLVVGLVLIQRKALFRAEWLYLFA